MSTETSSPSPVTQRLVSMDAYRGFVMLLMASEGLEIGRVAKQHPESPVWTFLHYQVSHVE